MVVQIFIKDPQTGQTHTVKLDGFQGTTVLDLKHKIRALEGTPEEIQRLIFEGKELVDECKLSDYGIQNASTIALIRSLRGGGLPGGPGDPRLGDKDGKNRSKETLCDF